MKYLIDTNVISELRRKNPNKNVVNWFAELDPDNIYLSCITIGEVGRGALKKAKTDKSGGNLLLQWVSSLESEFQDQIVDIDLEACNKWAELLNIDGTNAIDSLLAAQAIRHNMILATRNVKHFKMFEAKLINPFEAN